MLFCHHQASLASHAEACHLLWPLLVPTRTPTTIVVQARTGHRQSTSGRYSWRKVMTRGPGQLVQSMLRPGTYSYKLPMLHVYLLGCRLCQTSLDRASFAPPASSGSSYPRLQESRQCPHHVPASSQRASSPPLPYAPSPWCQVHYYYFAANKTDVS